MRVKFVPDGKLVPDNEKGEDRMVDMKTLPHVGERIILADDATYEITGITHTPDGGEFAALATIRPLNGQRG